MQKTIWKYLLYSAFAFVLVGCENDLDVAADWKEVAIIYGALNPSDTKNYIRIQRAYLDETQSAVSYFNEQDSLYFDTLIVQIDEYKNGAFVKQFFLQKVDGNDIGYPKDAGIFYSESNILYELSDRIQASSYTTDYTYTLSVKNPRTGYTCTANTTSIGNPQVSAPLNETLGTVQVSTVEDHTVFTRFQEGKWARAYSIEMVLRIEEFSLSDPTENEIKTLKWKMVNLGKTKRIEGFEEATYLIPSVNFFATVASQLQENPLVNRRLVDFDLKFYGISDDFNTYLSVNKPSIGIVQKKPEFTNVDNGLGIFTSRHIKGFYNRQYHNSTLSQLQLSEYTKNLGFVK
ncbi:hypothetical protein N8368_01130 [Bacteroidia bacterium]|nr:hypothetical protein [Bacteroidia bacterium]MDC1395090.1 hypothetical protein [Bacteroidia bacterium]